MGTILQEKIRTILKSSNVFEQARAYLFKIAAHYYERKLETDSRLRDRVRMLERIASIEDHYAHTQHTDHHAVLNLALYLAQMTLLLEARLTLDGFDSKRSTILDAGDPDGMVLKSLGAAKGVSLNILDSCTRQILQRGGRPVQGDCEALPFRDGTFDYVVCFETFEHLENPITGLRELGRVCNKKLFISIPWVKNTTIHRDNYQKDQPEAENHVFEFSRSDFGKIVTHTPVEISYDRRIEMFPLIHNPFHLVLLHQFYFPAYFPRFQFFELTKT